MKRIVTRIISVTAFASRSLWVIATAAILCAVPVATKSLPLFAKAPKTNTVSVKDENEAARLFYTTSVSSAGVELFAIHVSGSKITTTDIGPTKGGACISLALSPSGTLYSMCGALFGVQHLATIDPLTGLATVFGLDVPGLAVMSIAFGPDGTLYAVGDCHPVNGQCNPDADPKYNSLYTVDVRTGEFKPVGPTGAPQFFMDLALDRDGNMFGVTCALSPSAIPAILYRIDLATGKATKVVNLVGSNSVMGLAFGREGKLYATDFTQNPGLYLIDIKTGFEKAIAALPFGLSSSLELANPGEDERADQ